MTAERIPFKMDTERVIELLGKQLYQSPLALLRENTQNSYDAILMRRHLNPDFAASIEIVVAPNLVTVMDNGIGMTAANLRDHFWFAGSSSKNTDEARAAGVVGTFGIGAMANFGIAGELVVETESAVSGERTRSAATRVGLTLNHDCIDVEPLSSTGHPGTKVVAHILPGNSINVAEATAYVAEFIGLVDVPVVVNGVLVSGQKVERYVAQPPVSSTFESSACELGSRLTADVRLVISSNADIWVELSNIAWSGQQLVGRLTLRSGLSALRTCRSGFGLAVVSVSSAYHFGGVADLRVLQPTAGREALTTDSMALLQGIFVEIDAFTSVKLSELPESDSSTPFMNWANSHRRYDLCRNLRMQVYPGDPVALSRVERQSAAQPYLLYRGPDTSASARHGTEERPLLILARGNPRRQCEVGFLEQFCATEEVSDNPRVDSRKPVADLTIAERALVFRLESVLDTDYFLKARISFGKISHSLPMLVLRDGEQIEIVLDASGQAIALTLSLYENEYAAFGSMVRDFVRTALFPKIAEYVPSSTKRGAEAFLKMIRGKGREAFEYEDRDLGTLPSIWSDYAEGKITMEQAVARSVSTVRSSVQFVDPSARAAIRDVVPDVMRNEEAIGDAATAETLEATPAITRLDISCAAKLLTIPDEDPALRGYRCFLALTDKTREDFGEFFLQPHTTSVVWGGQKALFIFIHHSGRFGLYYDVQMPAPVAVEPGGKALPTCTMVLKDRIYIPITEILTPSFIPVLGERKRFEIRGDIIRTEQS